MDKKIVDKLLAGSDKLVPPTEPKEKANPLAEAEKYLHSTLSEIGGYSDKPKSDPNGQTRVAPTRTMPIRAFGESEVRRVPTMGLILSAKLRRLQRHGSRITKVAIKRAHKRERQRGPKPSRNMKAFKDFPSYNLSPMEPGIKPVGLPTRALLEELGMLRGRTQSWSDSTFGHGHGFYYNFSHLLDELNSERAAEHKKMVDEILAQQGPAKTLAALVTNASIDDNKAWAAALKPNKENKE